MNYMPCEGDTFADLLDKAFDCGRDLDPRDKRAEWIDDHPDQPGRTFLIEAYHAGQAERYADEGW